MWPKTDKHACWRVQRALHDAGVAYELVKVPLLPRSRRTDVIAGTGQDRVPAIELEDGSWWREESAAMAEAIRAGRLGTGSHP
jgi:glutathione S-transferase